MAFTRIYRGEPTRPPTAEEVREYQRLQRLAFPEKAKAIWTKHAVNNKEKRNAATRKYCREHPEKGRAWIKNNPERARAIWKRCREKHKESRKTYHREYCKRRINSDPSYKILCRLRSSLSEHLVGRKKSKKTLELLGCSIEDFRIYLESKFEVGMAWENYGRNGWHIDHIMPCALFDLNKPDHQKRCFHFSNMQPMWWRENIIKGHKLPDSQFNLL